MRVGRIVCAAAAFLCAVIADGSSSKGAADWKGLCVCDHQAAPECHKKIPMAGESVAELLQSCQRQTDKTGRLVGKPIFVADEPAAISCSGILAPPSDKIASVFTELDGAHSARLCVSAHETEPKTAYCWMDDPGAIPCTSSVYGNGCPHLSTIAVVKNGKGELCWIFRSDDVGRRRTLHFGLDFK